MLSVTPQGHCLALAAGVEPAITGVSLSTTPWLYAHIQFHARIDWHPRQESNPHHDFRRVLFFPLNYKGIIGAGDESRTHNIQFGKLTLYH